MEEEREREACEIVIDGESMVESGWGVGGSVEVARWCVCGVSKERKERVHESMLKEQES